MPLYSNHDRLWVTWGIKLATLQTWRRKTHVGQITDRHIPSKTGGSFSSGIMSVVNVLVSHQRIKVILRTSAAGCFAVHLQYKTNHFSSILGLQLCGNVICFNLCQRRAFNMWHRQCCFGPWHSLWFVWTKCVWWNIRLRCGRSPQSFFTWIHSLWKNILTFYVVLLHVPVLLRVFPTAPHCFPSQEHS